MTNPKSIALFAGIGGFPLAEAQLGWEVVAYSEVNEFCLKVLQYHFPEAKSLGNINTIDFTEYADTIDFLSGGFPCQPFSTAGKRKGEDDDRFLWPEMLRAIREIKPRVVMAENVAGLFSILEPKSISEMESKEIELFCEDENYAVNSTIERIQRRVIATIIEQIKQIGYCLPTLTDGTPIVCCIPACAVNAPHRRDRVIITAFRNNATNPHSDGQQRSNSQHEINPSEGGQYAFGDTEQGNRDGIAENTDQFRCSGNSGESQPRIGQLGNIGTGNNEQLPANHDEVGVNTNTKSGRYRRLRNESEKAGSCQSNQSFGGIHRISHATHPGSTGWQEFNASNITDEQRYGAGIGFANTGNWQNFPTQSPVCDGDDGLPTGLDGITFPKWRTESIKAGGNAVVPPLILELIKPIDAFFRNQ